MTRSIRSIILFLLLSILPASAVSAAPKATRAVSLNAIASAIKSGSGAEQAKSLCGITKLCGYLPDPASKDIVLLGVVDPDLPPLHLDDFVVALRNVSGAYCRVEGRTRYYSDPGCSIDPDPAVIAQLRDFNDKQPDYAGTDPMQARTEAWKNIGKQPQHVRVLGVPFDTHFAKIMVDADYYMKRLVNGSVALGIDGFSSLSDLDIDARRQLMRAGKDAKLVGGSLSRFWFSPGDSTYEVRDGATILRSCDVKLLTEQEYLNEHGIITQMGRPDPCADQFAIGFSQKYNQVAAARPIYKELKALFSFVAVARLMKDDRAERTAPGAIGFVLRGYKVPATGVNRAVSGLTMVRAIDENVDTPKGKMHLGLVQSTCGGVAMNVRPRRIKSYTPRAASVAVPNPTPKTTSAPLATPFPTPKVKMDTTPYSPPTTATAPASRVRAVPTAPAVRVTASEHSPGVKHATPVAASHHATTKAPQVRIAQARNIKHAVLSSRKSPTAMSWDVPVQLD